MNATVYKWVAGALVSVGIFVALLDTTIVDIVLPKMMSSLDTDLGGIQWVVIVYFIGSAIAMTAASWLADRIGPRRLYLLGLLLFLIASAFCGLAWNLPAMLVGRLIQGLGEGILVPVGLIILYTVFPEREHGTAMGLYGLSASFAPALGPTLGGVITEHLDWRWVFYINLPVGLVTAVLILALMRPLPRRGGRSFDFLGFALLGTALSALIVLLGKGQELGWSTSDTIVILGVVTLLATAATVAWLAWARAPLFPRSIFGRRAFRVGMAAMVLLSINAYGFFLLLPVFLQRLRGLTTLQAGLVLLPGALLSALTTLGSGIVSDRVDPRKVGLLFLLLTGWASWHFGTDPDTPLFRLVLDYMFWGAAVGGTFAPVTMVALGPLGRDEINDGSTLVNVARLVAGSVGTALATATLAARSDAFAQATRHFLEPDRPALAITLFSLTGADPTGGDPDAMQRALALGAGLLRRATTAWAFDAVFDLLAVFMVVAAATLAAAWLGRSGGRHPR